MLEYDRIAMPKGIDVSKTNGFHEYIFCQDWHSLKLNLRFQSKVCNGCHDLVLKAINFNDVAVVTVKGKDYRIHFLYMSKDYVINLSRNAELSRIVENIKIHYHI